MFLTTDYGDIIIAIKDQNYTDSISISLDHGNTFKTVPVTEDQFMILHYKRLKSHPEKILLSTARSTSKAKYSLLISLDLTKLIN
jgi:hypothetical protein